MKQLLFSVLAFIAGYEFSSAQCPDAQFTSSGPVCAGQALDFTNGSTGSVSYQWDFCSGDFINPASDTSDIVGSLNTPSGVEPVIDGGMAYVFVCSRGDDKLIRYDYGAGLNAAPTAIIDLGNVSGQISSPNGIALYKEGSLWYALVLSVFNNTVTRVEFGNGLGNAPTTASVIVNTNLNFPRGLEIVRDPAGNVLAVIANYIGSTLTVLDFGNSITNAPTVGTPITVTGSAGAIDVAVVSECGQWYGFVSAYNSSAIFKVDFGNSLNNVPGNITQFLSSLSAPTGISVVNDNNTWYLISSNTGNGKVNIAQAGSSLATGTAVYVADINLGAGNPAGINMIKEGTNWYGFVTMESTNLTKQLRFQNACDVNTSTSTDTDPASIIFNTGGTYHVAMEAYDANGISDAVSQDIVVSLAPVTAFSVSNTCFGDITQFTDSSTISTGTIASWHWEFGNGDTSDQASPVYSYGTEGTYIVSLTTVAINGCSSSISTSVDITPRPQALFTTSTGCSETLLSFMDQSTISSGSISEWHWDFGNGDTSSVQNAGYAYPSGGTFTVTLLVTSAAGCSDSHTLSLTVNDRPIGNFQASNTCVGQNTEFTNSSYVNGSTITQYNWNFGDGNTSTLDHPTHAYASSVGIYTVELIVTAANGCIDTLLQEIKINNVPVADFSFLPATACQGTDIQFTDISTVSGDTISAWYWDFGDGTIDTIANPVHRFQTAGPNIVRLIAYSPSSCPSALFQQTVDVVESPVAVFNSTAVCFGGTSQFDNFSVIPTGSTLQSVHWDFGTGDTSNLNPTVFYTYQTSGIFPVVLTVTTNFGCSNSDTVMVPVYALPVADFTYSNPCSGQAAQFTNTSNVDSMSALAAYAWNFGDFGSPSNSSTLANPTHVYNSTQSYFVFLIATTNVGCVDTVVHEVQIFTSAPSQFTYSPTCYGDLMEFFNPGSALDSAFLWNFGDNQTNQLQEPAHFYAFPGTYNVTLTVYAFSGCASTSSRQVTVSPIPVANFGTDPICKDVNYQFRDSSTISNGSIEHWDWIISGIGSLDTVPNPSATFSDTGTYSVTLQIVSDIGCTNSITKNVHVYPQPVANFSFNPQFGNPPLDVQFTDFSQGGNTYVWDFGDGSSFSSLHEPSHIYQDTGSFFIHQYVTNSYGCTDSIVKSVYVIKPVLDIAITGDSSYIAGDYFYVVARLANLGTREINSVNMEARLEDGTTIREKNENLIPNGPLGLQVYEFKAAFLISGNTNFDYYCITATDPNGETDNVPVNNERCFNRTVKVALVNPYPNPFTDELTVRLILPYEESIQIDLFDHAGKMIRSLYNGQANKGLLELHNDFSGLSDGVYSIRILFRDEEQYRRIVKQTPKN